MKSIGVAIVGSGSIALANHLPGLALTGRAKVVALCDSDPKVLEKAAHAEPGARLLSDYRQVMNLPEVDAVVVATPNFLHREIVLAAVGAGKHVMCEKPIAMDAAGATEMLDTARRANVRHMTAFTYRFVPAMRYLHHLVTTGALGEIWHFRAQRFQDWNARPLGWRQAKKLAGTGELGDMLSHRIDYAHHLVGPFARIVADLKLLVPQRGGQPADVDDWAAILGEFKSGPTGVLESTKLATGRGEGHRGQDVVELNGSEGTAVYSTQKPLELWLGKKGDADLSKVEVPRDFRVWPGSRRNPDEGDPLVTFRYDQSAEFINAIEQRRDCSPSFEAGVEAQKVMDAAVRSAAERRWVDIA
jgi:predicted dehydrogenase